MRNKPVTDQLMEYIEKLYCNELPTSASEIRQNYQARGRYATPDVQVSPIEGRFIQLLLMLIKAESVLEVGTMHGYSSSWILSALPEGGSLITIEKSLEAYEMASTNIKADGRVQLVNADANQFLPQLEQTFDAIFIDGNKSSYPFYLKQSARLLKTGGMLIVDDALLLSDMWLNSNTSELSSMQKGLIDFNLELSKSRFFQGLALPMFHGIAIAIRSDGRYIE